MRGYFDGRSMTGVEWVEARESKPHTFPDHPEARESYWEQGESPVFVVEEWCFQPADGADEERADRLDELREAGVKFCN